MTGSRDDRKGRAHARRIGWRDSLRTRIALWFALTTLLLAILVGVATALYVRDTIIDDARRDARATALETADRLDATLRAVAVTTQGLADLAATTTLTPEHRLAVLRTLLQATPGAAGGLLALEPGDGEAAFARYVGLDGRERDFVADGYDYRAQSWYRRTLGTDARWWSDPYENNTAGGIRMATYNVRAGAAGDARGMVSVDVPVAQLAEAVEPLAWLPGWRATLVSPGGIVAMSSEPHAQTMRPLRDWVSEAARDDLQPALDALDTDSFAHFDHVDAASGTRRYGIVEPIGDSGWSLLLSQSHDLATARLNRALLWLLAAVALLVLLGMLLVRWLARQISQPVEALAEAATRFGEGDYATPVAHIARADEMGLVARTLEQARTSIQRQLREIEEMAVARQRLDSELAIARDIQLALLPGGRLVAAGDATLDAQAVLEPAKAVGGDFYGFVERDHVLWFIIGDVSDKGIPAALFMARTLTVLEAAAQGADAPDRVLAAASGRLVEGNDTCMFATVLCGRIDAASGDCTLASAGHDPPLLRRADGGIEVLALDNGPPLGVEADASFAPLRLRLQPGDCLLAITDGVTEAFDPDGEAFGDERLLAALRPDDDALGHCRRIVEAVRRFVRAAPQSDDITVLAIRRDRDPDLDTPAA